MIVLDRKFCLDLKIFFRRWVKVLKILMKSQLKLGAGKSLPCSNSGQCSQWVYLSCDDKFAETYYVFRFSIEELSKKPEINETTMDRVYQASARVTFDSEMIGINVFKTGYPGKIESFVVMSDKLGSDSWYLLFLEKNARKLSSDCFSPHSKIGYPVFCAIPIPSEHSLKYVSITNKTLWMHTSFQGLTHDEPIPTCYLMNDCFGCILMGNMSKFKCKWDSDFCTKSSENYPAEVSGCIWIERVEMDNKTLSVQLIGVNLNNTFMSAFLKLPDQRLISTRKISGGLAKFSMDLRDLSLVEMNFDKTFIVVHNSKFRIEVNTALDHIWSPNGQDYLLNVVIIILLIVLVYAFYRLYRGCSSKEGVSPSLVDSSLLEDSMKIPKSRIIGSSHSITMDALAYSTDRTTTRSTTKSSTKSTTIASDKSFFKPSEAPKVSETE